MGVKSLLLRRYWLVFSASFLLSCGILSPGTSSLTDRRPEGTTCFSGTFQATNSVTGTAFIVFSSEQNRWYLYLENVSLPEANLRVSVEVMDPAFTGVVTATSGNKTFTLPNPTSTTTIDRVRLFRAASPSTSLSTAPLQRINNCGGTTI